MLNDQASPFFSMTNALLEPFVLAKTFRLISILRDCRDTVGGTVRALLIAMLSCEWSPIPRGRQSDAQRGLSG